MKSGEEAFNQFFLEVYGERWPQIYSSLKNDDAKIARRNLFMSDDEISQLNVKGVGEAHPDALNSFILNEEFNIDEINSSIIPYYRMDPASLAPAYALSVEPGDLVLDMCAAPGGKSLLLIEALTGAGQTELDLSGKITANELSAKRRHRMMTVFKRYLPKEVRSIVNITGKDGAKFGLHNKESFHKILLDAPCSGERGVVQKATELAAWKPKRSKSFGIRQYSLLSAAFMALKPGGRIVYSTCSLSPLENDEVVKKLIKRQGSDSLKILDIEPNSYGDQTEFGMQFLPDKMGWGPIYYSMIEKN